MGAAAHLGGEEVDEAERLLAHHRRRVRTEERLEQSGLEEIVLGELGEGGAALPARGLGESPTQRLEQQRRLGLRALEQRGLELRVVERREHDLVRVRVRVRVGVRVRGEGEG